MAANLIPIYIATPIIGCVKIPATQAIVSNTGGTPNTDATNTLVTACRFGSFGGVLDKIRIIAVGSAATSMTSTPTIIRVFVSSVAITQNVASTINNTRLILEYGITQTTIPVANATTAGTFSIDIPMNIPIDAGDYIHVAQSVATTTNTQWQVCVYGGNY